MKALWSSLAVLAVLVAIAGCGSGGSTTGATTASPHPSRSGPEAAAQGTKPEGGGGTTEAQQPSSGQKSEKNGPRKSSKSNGSGGGGNDGSKSPSQAESAPTQKQPKSSPHLSHRQAKVLREVEELVSGALPGKPVKPTGGSTEGGSGNGGGGSDVGAAESSTSNQVIELVEQMIEEGSVNGTTPSGSVNGTTPSGSGSGDGDGVQEVLEGLLESGH